jgi:hypothetical protein
MDPAELQQRLVQLAQLNPGEHPYSLALGIQVETGIVMTGRQAEQILHRLEMARVDLTAHDRL